jgi:hypothetical protein
LKRADAQMARGDARQHRAGQHLLARDARSPVSATARLRVVGSAKPNIASEIRNSRSIGPSAALPSPPRE